MINLLPDEFKQKKDYKRQRKKILLGVLSLMIIFAAISYRNKNYKEVLFEEVVKKEGLYQQLLEQKQRLEIVEQKKNKANQKEKLLAKLEDNYDYSEMFSSLNYLLLPELWLKRFHIDESYIFLVGASLSEEAIIKTLDNLNKSDYYKNFNLKNLQFKENEYGKKVQFNLKGEMNKPDDKTD